MAGLTKGILDDLITSVNTYLDSGDYANARLYLLKAMAVHETLPNTDKLSWRGSLDAVWKRLLEQENIDGTRKTARRMLLRRDRG